MKYFTEDYLAFFKELAANNSKEWFDKNRKRYDKSVKEPFKRFTQAVIDRVFEDHPNDKVETKDAIFRINRDIRFSDDKTPYKTQMSAIVTKGGKKDKTSPGLYFEMGPAHIRVYGGVYMPDKDQLQGIREYIAKYDKAFSKAINDPGFKKTYGEIRGEKNKRLPKELEAAAKEQPLIYNKSFYYFTELEPHYISDDRLLDMLMERYEHAEPVRSFLAKALKY